MGEKKGGRKSSSKKDREEGTSKSHKLRGAKKKTRVKFFLKTFSKNTRISCLANFAKLKNKDLIFCKL